MSTITKEWLLKTIAELEEERDATPGDELARRRQEWALLAAGNAHAGIDLSHGVDPVLLKRQQPLTAEFVQVFLGAEVRHAGRERGAQLVEQLVEYLRHLLDRRALLVLLWQVMGHAAHLLAVVVTHLLCKRFHRITP